jgi:hypothetical protein
MPASSVIAAAALLAAAPAPADHGIVCTSDHQCSTRMSADQVLHVAERMVLDRKFAEVRPLLAALENTPQYKMERQFLLGYVAVETGDLDAAARAFRAVLSDHPEQTRVRLELARVLMAQGKDAAADHHFRLAAQRADLPPEIERTIRASRAIIRSRRNWYFNVDFGLAPDTNINSATNSETQATTFEADGRPVELVLDKDARRRSGVGQTLGLQAGARLSLAPRLALAIDASGNIVNQRGTRADDIATEVALGPEISFAAGTRLSLQGVGAARWYGGKAIQKGGGARLTAQKDLSAGQRLTGRFELRRYDSDYGPDYAGWSFAGSAGYERVVKQVMIASVTGFARREALSAPAYSSVELGVNAGIGGELSHGVNAGLSASLSRAWYDAPITWLSPDTRKDWRLFARANVGLRSIRVLGFSPSITYTFSRNASGLALYDTTRHRLQFALARYF